MQESVPRLKATARGQVRFFGRGQELVAEQEPKAGLPSPRFPIDGQAKPLPMRLRLLLALLLGALSALAMPPFFLWPVLFPTLSGLVLLLDGLAVDRDVELLPLARWRSRVFKGAGVGWAFGCGYFGA